MLMMFWEVQRLTREINHLERQQLEIHNKLSNFQKYASKLGGSSTNITIRDIAGLSSKLIPRATVFAQFANQASSMSAMQNVQMMKMYGMIPTNLNPTAMFQIEMSAFAKFKQESMKALKQREADVLAEAEKDIQLEANNIEMQLKMKRAKLESVKQQAHEDARNSAPKFGNA